MTLRTAYNSGVKAALQRFKVAGPLGADYGVMPQGEALSHGTALNANAPRSDSNPAPGEAFDDAARMKAEGTSDLLWNLSEYDKLAAGGAGGQYGQEEVIG